MAYADLEKIDEQSVKYADQTLFIDPKPSRGFVRTEKVNEIASRALNYIKTGFPVHFRGPTGTGKTTLALHVAHKLRQPVIMMHGNDEYTTADLTGKSQGFSHKKMVDEFVRGVSKSEEELKKNWVDHRLTLAVKNGYTLLYDEFTRSRPEANNILLSILQEGVLDMPIGGANGEYFVKVHPDFKVIFTSNPEEYAGVHKSQDALLDRMVTIDLGHYDHETEVRIVSKKCLLTPVDAEGIINIARALRESATYGYLPTIRGCIMVGKSVKRKKGAIVSHKSKDFRHICHDVFISEMTRNADKRRRKEFARSLDRLIDIHCGAGDLQLDQVLMQAAKEQEKQKSKLAITEAETEPSLVVDGRRWSIEKHDWIKHTS